MRDEEVQLKAQTSLQEYNDAVERLDPKFRELGQKAVADLDGVIKHWSDKHYMQPSHRVDPSGDGAADLRKYASRQIEWARDKKDRVLAQLSTTKRNERVK